MFRHDDGADVLGRSEQPHAANQILLLALFDVVPAGIHIAATERGEDLLEYDAVRLHSGKVDVHLILLDEPAAADHVGDAGRHLQLTLDHPVLEAAQLGWTRMVRDEAKAVQLADRRRQRRQLRLDLRRKIGLLQPLEHPLPREVVVHLIVEGDREKRQAELRVREHPHRMRYAGQHDLERNGDLLLHLLSRVAGHECDHGGLHVGDVGKRLHRQRLKGDDARPDEQHCDQHQEERLIQRKCDELPDHQLARCCSSCRSRSAPSTTMRSPGRRPVRTLRLRPSPAATSTARLTKRPGASST